MSVEWIIAMMVLGFVLGYGVRKRKQKQKMEVLSQKVATEFEHTPPNEGNVYQLANARTSLYRQLSVTTIDAHHDGGQVFKTSVKVETRDAVEMFKDPKLKSLFENFEGRETVIEALKNEFE